MAKEKRFIKTYSQGCGSMEIWVDTKTGVNYIYRCGGYGGGLTPLLDATGKPVVTSTVNGDN
ncbi:MAG: xylan 1,4-beta-xylosidase [Ruminococcaceae bacterium]|nr:xylan 1,4-beta-xylosidase [Oscillospiraceae bacterium]